MSDQSSDQLEREAEAARARMAGTAESIRRKLTAGQLMDEFTDMFTGGDLSGAAHNLKAQVRDNPLPLALVGAGIAWLMFGKGVSAHHHSSSSHSTHLGHSTTTRRPPDPGYAAGYGQGASHTASASSASSHGGKSTMSSVKDSAKSAAGSVGSTVSGVAGSVSDTVSGVAGSVSDTVGGMADSLSHTADKLRHSMLSGMPHSTRDIRDSVSSVTQQEPLLISALGLAVGALVGAMLPATELEKEQIGPYKDRLREGAKDMVDKGVSSAERVASKAYDAMKEEADRQGLAPGDGPSIGERVGNVVKSAAQTAEDAARKEMGAGTDKDRPGTRGT